MINLDNADRQKTAAEDFAHTFHEPFNGLMHLSGAEWRRICTALREDTLDIPDSAFELVRCDRALSDHTAQLSRICGCS